MIKAAQLDQVMGSTLYDRDGDKIGQVGQVYLDDDSGEPSWMTVNTGLFGTSESFVPLQQAELDERGLRVPYEKARVKGAPHAADDGHLDEAEQDELYRYYGLAQRGAPEPAAEREPNRDGEPVVGRVDRTDDGALGGASAGTAAGAVAGTAAVATAQRSGSGDSRSVDAEPVGPRPVQTRTIDPRDGAGTSSAETADPESAGGETRGRHASDGPVDGGAPPAEASGRTTSAQTTSAQTTSGQPGGRMRLRRYVVTEQRTITVPVTHEEVRLESADTPPTGGTLVDEVELDEARADQR